MKAHPLTEAQGLPVIDYEGYAVVPRREWRAWKETSPIAKQVSAAIGIVTVCEAGLFARDVERALQLVLNKKTNIAWD